MGVAAGGAGGPEMLLSELLAARLQALSSVVAEVQAPVLSLEAPLAHSDPPDAVKGEQGAHGRVKRKETGH